MHCTTLDLAQAQSSAQTMETAAAVLGNGAAINDSAGDGVLSNGAAGGSAAEESALSTEPGRRRRVADAAVRAAPAGRDAVGQAGPDSSVRPPTRSSMPRAAASRSQHSDRPEESTHVVAQREPVKTEPAAAAAGPASTSFVAEPGRAAGNGRGVTPGPSVLPPPEDVATMRRLVAQLAASEPPAPQIGGTLSRPLQQAALGKAAAGMAAASAPLAVQQPGMPMEPRPTRMYALTRRSPQATGHEQAACAAVQVVASSGAAPIPGSVPAAAGTLPSGWFPRAAAQPAIGVDAWLRGLPPVIRRDLESVKELVLPLKKLKLLADIDAHLYNFSKSAGWQLRVPASVA